MDKRQVYIEASFVGFARSVIGLPFEHPFDSIKSRLQAEASRKLTFLQMTKEIYRNYGITHGFYAGFLPSAARNIVKQVYRWPLMLIFPEFFTSVYPESLKKSYPSIAKVSTAFALAAIDTFVFCPFERLKVYLQTKPDSQHFFKEFISQNREKIIRSLFKGLDSLFYRQIISWVSFLYSDYKFKHWARDLEGLGENDHLNNPTLVLVSVLVGVSNVLIVMPFDMTKTLHQQHSNEFSNKGLGETMKIVYKRNGIKGFYTGWQPRMMQYVINSFFTVTALEKMEERMKTFH